MALYNGVFVNIGCGGDSNGLKLSFASSAPRTKSRMKTSSTRHHPDTRSEEWEPARFRTTLTELSHMLQSGKEMLWSISDRDLSPAETRVRDRLNNEGLQLQMETDTGLQGGRVENTQHLLHGVRIWADRVRDWCRRHLRSGSNRQSQQNDLEIHRRLENLENLVSRQGVRLDQVWEIQNSRLAPELEDQIHTWSEKNFEPIWQSSMNGIQGAETMQWTLPSRRVADWFDNTPEMEWESVHRAAQLHENMVIPPDGMRCDLYDVYEYELPDGTPRAFMLVGETTVSVNQKRLNRLVWTRAKLAAYTPLPVVICLFTQFESHNPEHQAQMENEGIVHFRRGANRYFKVSYSQLDQIMVQLPDLNERAIRPRPDQEKTVWED